MLRILIVLAAFVWLGLMLSGTGKDRLRPGLEAARKSGEPIVEIDPLHTAPLREADAGPAPVIVPEAAPKLAAVAGGEAQATPADAGTGNSAPAGAGEETDAIPGRKRRVAPVFTLSDLPPAGQVEAIPRSPGESANMTEAGAGITPESSGEADPLFITPLEAAASGIGEGAIASPPGEFTVTADALNLRDTPSTDGGVLYRLEHGDSVQVIGDSGGGWVEVLAGDGALRGYVSARFLAPAP